MEIDSRHSNSAWEQKAYCWFASDVTTAMLVVKNKSVSLRWEMNSILMQILPKIFFCIDHQHGHLVTWLQTKNENIFHGEFQMFNENRKTLKWGKLSREEFKILK